MDTKALRQKILDLAIRGKLIPQDPNDEPASVLLERIRAEKQQMVKDGRLKAKDVKNDTIIFVGEDNLHYEKFADGTVKCIEDEIPFDVPDGWEWERLSNIAAFSGGKTPSTSHREFWDGNVLWVTSKDMKSKYISSSLLMLSEKGASQMQLYPSDTILMVTRSGILRHTLPVAILKSDATVNQDIKAICLYDCSMTEWVYSCLKGMEEQLLLRYTKSGTTVENINFDEFIGVLLPIPPSSEKSRIIDRVEKACKAVDVMDEEKTALGDAVVKAKALILDLAIRGRLVPQNPDDEPASVLLDRIRAEKEELVKQGNIKRDKRESFIFRGEDNSYYEKVRNECICIDDDLPYDIPVNWAWCELQDCCYKEIKRGRSPKYADTGKVLSFAQKCNQKSGSINISLAQWIDDSSIDRYDEDEYMLDGDIVINSTGTGTLGRVGIYHDSDNHARTPIVPDSHVTIVRTSSLINSSYIFLCLKAMQSNLEELGEGSTNQKELKPLTIQQQRIPVPPLDEQHAIVKRVYAFFEELECVEANLR